MDCEKCGAALPGGARFCPSCGTPAGPPDESGAQASRAGAQLQQPPPPGPAPPPAGFQPPPPGMPPYGPGAYQFVRNNPLCVAALILGIVSLVLAWGPLLGIAVAVAGIVCAVLGMQQVDQNPEAYRGKNLGQAGLVMSIIGAALTIVWHLLWWSSAWWWH